MDKINHKHEIFINSIVSGLGKTESAIKAGYASRSAHTTANRLFNDKKIGGEIRARMRTASKLSVMSANEVLHELSLIGGSDPRSLYTLGKVGKLTFKSWDEVPDELTRVVRTVKQMKDGSISLGLYDKTKALELLAKHHDLLAEKKEEPGASSYGELVARLREGEQLNIGISKDASKDISTSD